MTASHIDLTDVVVTIAVDAARRVLADRERLELDETALDDVGRDQHPPRS